MIVVFEETSLKKDFKYRVEVHYKDDKVTDLVKGAVQNSEDGIITSYDIEQWIGAALEGNINIFIKSPDAKLFYIGPRTWRMEILARLPTAALAREVITEIEIKTAKKLTELVQSQKNMKVPPMSFSKWVDQLKKENPKMNLGEEVIKAAKEIIENTDKEMSKMPHNVDVLKYVDKSGIVFCAWFKTDWKKDETINISIDDVFNECITQFTVTLDKPNINFAKTIENVHKVGGFYHTIYEELENVEILGEALKRCFEIAYGEYFCKEIRRAVQLHNVNARAMCEENKKKTTEDKKKATVHMSNIRCITIEDTLPNNLKYRFTAFVDFGKDFSLEDICHRDTTPVKNCNLVLQYVGSIISSKCTIAFDMSEVDSAIQFCNLITHRARFYQVSSEDALTILNNFRAKIVEVCIDVTGRNIDTKFDDIKHTDLLNTLNDMYNSEAEWVATSKEHRRVLYELDHLDEFQTAMARQKLKFEERKLKVILKSLRNRYEEDYQKLVEAFDEGEV